MLLMQGSMDLGDAMSALTAKQIENLRWFASQEQDHTWKLDSGMHVDLGDVLDTADDLRNQLAALQSRYDAERAEWAKDRERLEKLNTILTGKLRTAERRAWHNLERMKDAEATRDKLQAHLIKAVDEQEAATADRDKLAAEAAWLTEHSKMLEAVIVKAAEIANKRIEAGRSTSAGLRAALKTAIQSPQPYKTSDGTKLWHRVPRVRPCIGCDLEDALNGKGTHAAANATSAPGNKTCDRCLESFAAEKLISVSGTWWVCESCYRRHYGDGERTAPPSPAPSAQPAASAPIKDAAEQLANVLKEAGINPYLRADLMRAQEAEKQLAASESERARLAAQLEGMTGERDSEREIAVGWERKYEVEAEAHIATRARAETLELESALARDATLRAEKERDEARAAVKAECERVMALYEPALDVWRLIKKGLLVTSNADAFHSFSRALERTVNPAPDAAKAETK